jgi:hypothetical protein
MQEKQNEPFMGARRGIRRRPTLPRNCSRSTIGAEELNDRVRDGNGCGLLAIATGNRIFGFGQNPTTLGFFAEQGFFQADPGLNRLPR